MSMMCCRHIIIALVLLPCCSQAWGSKGAAEAIAQQLTRLVASHCSTGAAAQSSKLHAELAGLVDLLGQLAREGATSAPLLRRLCLAVLWRLQAAGLQAGVWGQQHEALLQEALLLWRAVHYTVSARLGLEQWHTEHELNCRSSCIQCAAARKTCMP